MAKGKIIWVSGPVVKAYGPELAIAKMHDMVKVGPENLIGEIIKLENQTVFVQVYEETSGLKPGDPLITMDKPLVVMLGPGLLGNIFDGIQRPLLEIWEEKGEFVPRGLSPRSNALPAPRATGMNLGRIRECSLPRPLQTTGGCSWLYPHHHPRALHR